MSSSTNDTVATQIIRSFSDPGSSMRTLAGVSRETGLPVETVQSFLQDHPELFRPSSLAPSGEPIYSVREEAWPQIVGEGNRRTNQVRPGNLG